MLGPSRHDKPPPSASAPYDDAPQLATVITLHAANEFPVMAEMDAVIEVELLSKLLPPYA